MEDLELFVLYNIFDRSKIRQKITKTTKMKRKRCQGRRTCTAGFLPRYPGKVYRVLRGVPLLASSSLQFFVLGRPRNLLVSYKTPHRCLKTSCSLVDAQAPKVGPKTSQDRFQNQSQNEAKSNMELIRKS